MIELKKYKRFFAFGCSMTSYFWPTWADIIAQEIPEYYNYGASGGGNLFISNQVAEANLKHKFTDTDLVIIMWSTATREDRYVNRNWLLPGNIFTQGFYDEAFITKFVDPRGQLIRDMALITMCSHMLEHIGVDHHMLAMAPFDYTQKSTTNVINDCSDVLEHYKPTVDKIKKDLFTIACNKRWPSWVIKGPGGGIADYHPGPAMHLDYLNKVFTGTVWAHETIEFVKLYQAKLEQSEHVDEINWRIESPNRL
jgi:hypothetical protein